MPSRPRLVTGHLTEYRRVVAQMERPELFAELGVRSFAVCGVLRCAGGVVVGRRHRAANYQAGMWQLAPAGSVDAGAVGEDGAVDLRRQLFGELREELGLSVRMWWTSRGRSASWSIPAATCRISAWRWSRG